MQQNPLSMFQLLFKQATALASKSTALNPLIVIIFILIAATFVSFSMECPIGVSIFLIVALGLSLALYLIAYTFFMFKNPDALRSEKFTLKKEILQRAVFGDDLRGILDDDEMILLAKQQKTLEAPKELSK